MLQKNCLKTALKLPQNCLKTFGFALTPSPPFGGFEAKKSAKTFGMVSQVLGGGCPKLRWHFKACQNPRVVLENTLWAKSCATPFSEPVTLLNHSAIIQTFIVLEPVAELFVFGKTVTKFMMKAAFGVFFLPSSFYF